MSGNTGFKSVAVGLKVKQSEPLPIHHQQLLLPSSGNFLLTTGIKS
jgi:hypothetical protein